MVHGIIIPASDSEPGRRSVREPRRLSSAASSKRWILRRSKPSPVWRREARCSGYRRGGSIETDVCAHSLE